MKIEEIQRTHTTLLEKMDTLCEIQTQTHAQYKEYLEKNKTHKVFGLDSFNYQTRLFDLEMKQVKEQYAFVNNRIYCDYYKLYGMVKTFYKENFKLEPKKRNYMPYKDLEPFKPFEFLDSMNLNQDIVEMIQKSFDIVRKKEEEVSIGNHSIHRHNLDNYILNHRYNNDSLKTKVELYEKYLHSYHIYHMAFLSNLLEKVQMLFRQNTQPLMSPVEPVVNEILSSDVPVVSDVPMVSNIPPTRLTDASNVSVTHVPVVPLPVVPLPLVSVAVVSVPVVPLEEVPLEEAKKEPEVDVVPVSVIHVEETKASNDTKDPKETKEPAPVEESAMPIENTKEENKEEMKEEHKEETKEETNEYMKEESEEPKEETKEETNEYMKEETEEPKKESKEETNEYMKEEPEMSDEEPVPVEPASVSVEVQAVVPQEIHEKMKKKSKKSKK